jgi:hypothetical protein
MLQVVSAPGNLSGDTDMQCVPQPKGSIKWTQDVGHMRWAAELQQQPSSCIHRPAWLATP